MAALLVKRGIWIGIGLLALVLALTAIASFVAGSRIIGAGLPREMNDITGRRLVFSGEPVIRIFPALTAEFRDVSLHDPKNASDLFPIVEVPVMRVSLSAFAALKGQARITGVTLEKPVFHAKANDGRLQLPFGDQARLAKLVAEISTALPEAPEGGKAAVARDNALGTIIIKDGTISLNASGAETASINDRIGNLDGTFNWQTATRNGNLKASFIWRGEPAKLDFTTDDVVMLAAGADTGIGVAFVSAPVTSRFTGKVRLLPSPYVEGSIVANANSLLDAAQWQGLKPPFEFAGFGLTLSGALKGDADKWQLEDSQLQWGTNKGTGGLIFQPAMTPPMLSGTLDFETLDLAMLTRLFEQSPKAQQANAPAIGADLRISASAASFGALALSKVAASLQISKETNALDIHDAAAFGGTLQMALKSQNSPAPKTELRILANDVETKALAALGGPFADLPQARGSLSAILSGTNIASPEFFETAAGTVKLRLGAGTVPGMNANQMVRALRKGGFFAMKAEAPSVLSFNEINAEATLAQGTLQFNPLQIGLDKAALNLTGAYAVKDQSLALTGTLDLEAGHPEAPDGAETLNVFFGGNRKAPLMSGLEGKP
jgi:AsmA protein